MPLIKKIDKLLISSFVGPYVVTFFIALFVLVMQTLWLYIDEIAGKGVGLFLLVELISYMSVSFFPMALAIATLISSVMVLGNMAEHYELSSIKSAGVPLFRTIQPLLYVVFGIAAFSLFCSNTVIPVSNLKFRSRLYDIRRQKPTLNLKPGTFNTDFKGFTIRIGKKHNDNKTIEDVLIYDQSEINNNGKVTVITAKKGIMYVTEDDKYFVMELQDGMQSYEPSKNKKSSSSKDNSGFSRTYFNKWSKVFDLSEFELDRTDTELFKTHYSMLTINQLSTAIDSIDNSIIDRQENLKNQSSKYYYPLKKQILLDRKNQKQDKIIAKEIEKVNYQNYMKETNTNYKDSVVSPSSPSALFVDSTYIDPLLIGDDIRYNSFYDLVPQQKKSVIKNKAISYVKSLLNQGNSQKRIYEKTLENKIKHQYELQSKFSTAMACIVFLFIGAPMGAIIRKGGFGFPLLVSIIFFMLFMVITIFSKNMALRFVIDPRLAAWIAIIILSPFGIYITYAAMTDKKIISLSFINNGLNLIKNFFFKSTRPSQTS